MNNPDLQLKREKLEKNLRSFWGFETLRDGQIRVMDALYEGKDVLVLFPTGGGKSLCYQLPATLADGLTLVISPLVALMQDQVQQLNEKGISATFINSTIPSFEIEQRLINARNGMYKLLYCSPERLSTPLFQNELAALNIQILAVDEAHCISQWGHDFRPAYREIRTSLESLDGVQWIALTATATPEVRDDIISNLEFEAPAVIATGFERPNLKWWVLNTQKRHEKLIKTVKKALKKGNGLLYCNTRQSCEDYRDDFIAKGIKAEAYHAGIDHTKRKSIQKQWIDGELSLVAATNAFGMGIDKPDCRFVVHHQMPFSLEAYYQEAGRAGRDGQEAYPILFYRPYDYEYLHKQIEQYYPSARQIQKVYSVVCDELNLAVNSEMEEAQPIALDSLRKRSKLNPLTIKAALNVLKNTGVIVYEESKRPQIGVWFLKSEDILRDYIDEHKNIRKAEFVDKLTRIFGRGAWNDMVYLDLEYVSEKLHTGINGLKKAMAVLSRNDQLLTCEFRGGVPMVKLVEARTSRMPIDKNQINDHREILFSKLNYVKQYAETSKCREVFLRTYFGEQLVKPCGHCDNCLQVHNPAVKLSEEEIKSIKSLLKEHSLTGKEICKKTGINMAKVRAGLRLLIREGKIQTSYTHKGKFEWLQRS